MAVKKRLREKATAVAKRVQAELLESGMLTTTQLKKFQHAAKHTQFKFPRAEMVNIKDLWIDYEVQRDVLHKHIINIMKKWDARICSPVSACRLIGTDRTDAYDGQHRTIAAGILGFTEIPCAVVETNDPNFPSYAFEMLNDTGVKRLNPGDLHRNALVRYKNGSRDKKVVDAQVMQNQFDAIGVDLQDKGSRKSVALRGDNDYFFSHFKYAQKAIELDNSGAVLYKILSAITKVFPNDEEIDQGIYIGLYELQRLKGTSPNIHLPEGWMVTLLKSVKKTFKGSHIVHDKAKRQWEHRFPGAGWSAPSAMANFLRELHIRNGGKLNLPYHGEGAKMGIEAGNIADGLFPEA